MRHPVPPLWVMVGLCTVASVAPVLGQTIVYSLTASAAELTTGLHQFGFRDDASSGVDEFDIPEPPTPPDDYLGLAFAMSDPAVPLPNRWRDDIRWSFDFSDKVELWELHISTDRVGAECVVDLAIEEGGQFELKLKVIGLSAGEIVVPVPGQFSLTIVKPETTLWLELSSDEPIANTATTWGRVKACYR